MTPGMEDTRKKILAIEDELKSFLVEREGPIHGLTLALLSQTNILFLGSPGTAKSMLVKEYAKRVASSSYFEWLLTKFSTPDEVFGPISAKGLEDDHYRRITSGKLPEKLFAFLDEIFKSNSGMLNSLLPTLCERIFYNDGQAVPIPLICLVGASNEIPDEDDQLQALYDRFHLKYHVQPIQEQDQFLRMLKMIDIPEPETYLTLDEIKACQIDINTVNIGDGILNIFSKIRTALNKEGIVVTDRTYKVATKIVRAEAWLSGNKSVDESHFEILQHLFWQDPDKIRKVQSIILDLTNPEKNKIQEIYGMCVNLINQIKSLPEHRDRHEQGISSVEKLRAAQTEMDAHRKIMLKKKKEVKEVDLLITEVNSMLLYLFNECCGIKMGLVELTKLKQNENNQQ